MLDAWYQMHGSWQQSSDARWYVSYHIVRHTSPLNCNARLLFKGLSRFLANSMTMLGRTGNFLCDSVTHSQGQELQTALDYTLA
eukprot:2310405-Pleurochrysis_carterae.AAC.1